MRRLRTDCELTEWRSRLIATFPNLFPDARLVRFEAGDRLVSTGWPSVGDGWRDIVERLCRRLDAVAARARGSLSIQGIDEKYAIIRVRIVSHSLTAAQDARADLAVELAEARSALVCDVCGERGRVVERGGWLQARCNLHRQGEHDRHEDPDDGSEPERASSLPSRNYDFASDTFDHLQNHSKEKPDAQA